MMTERDFWRKLIGLCSAQDNVTHLNVTRQAGWREALAEALETRNRRRQELADTYAEALSALAGLADDGLA